MPHVTFIFPCIGRFPHTLYVRSWQMQPLSIGILSALTPPHWERSFFDDRMEIIDFDRPTDLAAISIETYTAARGYQIAAEYRKRGVRVVMGGYHATFCPDEVLGHADAVCVGEAEDSWGRMLQDHEQNRLSGLYEGSPEPNLENAGVDRSIFEGKRYLDIALVETSRGCSFQCKFCSISSFHRARYRKRPVDRVIEEMKGTGSQTFFFVDDNIACDPKSAKTFFSALQELRFQWIGQAGIHIADDPELLELLVKSGCLGLLIGFESLDADNLRHMGKGMNRVEWFRRALGDLRDWGILVYGTFLFGNPFDTPELIDRTVRFAVEQKMFLAAFNHLIPFPGTPFYQECQKRKRLHSDPWWLNEDFRFGQVPFEPESMPALELAMRCHEARRHFYGVSSLSKRGWDFKANAAGLRRAKLFLALNLLLRREISQKRGIPLGVRYEKER